MAKTLPSLLVLGVMSVGGLLGPPVLARGPLVGGGPIRYNKYAGTAIITRVEQTAAANTKKANAT